MGKFYAQTIIGMYDMFRGLSFKHHIYHGWTLSASLCHFNRTLMRVKSLKIFNFSQNCLYESLGTCNELNPATEGSQ